MLKFIIYISIFLLIILSLNSCKSGSVSVGNSSENKLITEIEFNFFNEDNISLDVESILKNNIYVRNNFNDKNESNYIKTIKYFLDLKLTKTTTNFEDFIFDANLLRNGGHRLDIEINDLNDTKIVKNILFKTLNVESFYNGMEEIYENNEIIYLIEDNYNKINKIKFYIDGVLDLEILEPNYILTETETEIINIDNNSFTITIDGVTYTFNNPNFNVEENTITNTYNIENKYFKYILTLEKLNLLQEYVEHTVTIIIEDNENNILTEESKFFLNKHSILNIENPQLNQSITSNILNIKGTISDSLTVKLNIFINELNIYQSFEKDFNFNIDIYNLNKGENKILFQTLDEYGQITNKEMLFFKE